MAARQGYQYGRQTPPMPAPPRQATQLSQTAQRYIPQAGGRFETASAAGTEPSEAGGGYPKAPDHMPSYQVHHLAGDIANLESRCNFLEDRNTWLTKKLLTAQRKFIERTLMSSGKVKMQRSFEGWREMMHELRLERQLDQQTRSLDECQKIARELGQALTEEQSMRAELEAAHADTRSELDRALEEEQMLKSRYKQGQRHLELLEKRVHEAQNCLVRSRAEAQNVIDMANQYERECREMDSEAKHPARPENMIEYSVKLRHEAQGTMQKVQPLLVQRPMSPEREPY